MADETRRIKDFAVTTSPSDTDVLAVDSDANGTRGISFIDLVQRVFNRIGFTSIGGGTSIFSGTMTATDFVAGQNRLSEKANKSQVDTLQSQINNAISSVSSGDTEVTDIRIKTDGTIATTAGEAVRDQVEDLQTQIDANAVSVEDAINELHLETAGKVDNGYVEDGVAYFTSNGDVLFQITGIGGGGEGGGGGGNNAVITVTNTTGWNANTVSYGYTCNLSINWSSIDDDQPTGSGSLSVTVNGAAKVIRTVQQGDVTINVTGYLSTGMNTVRLKVSDVYGNSRTIIYQIQMVALTLTSSFSSESPFTGAISFPYVPTGNLEKRVKFYVDGTLIGTQVTSVSGRQQTYTIPAQTHGSHTLRVYFEATINEQTVLSNELYYDLICLEDGVTTPIIASSYNQDTATQYTAIAIPYYVYDPAGLTASVTLKANGATVNTLTVDRTQQVWTYRALEMGELTLAIQCGATTKTFVLDITESDMDAKAETEDLALYLTSEGRSNAEEHPEAWTYGTGQDAIAATLSNFNFVSDGWVLDDDDNTCLRVTGNARVTIPYQIFAQDFRGTGKTIEFEFASSDVRDYDAVILSCFVDNRGIQLTPQKMFIKSEQSELDVQYKEDEHVRVSFVIEKRTENRLIYCYLNGIISAIAQYPNADDFQQPNPVGISIGSNLCTTDIYNIRIYDNDLTRYQMLDNWIADTQNVDLMLARYRHNNVFNEYGAIVIEQLPIRPSLSRQPERRWMYRVHHRSITQGRITRLSSRTAL